MCIELPRASADTRLWPPDVASRVNIPEWVMAAWLEEGAIGKIFDVTTKDPNRRFTVSVAEASKLANERAGELAWARRVGRKRFRNERWRKPWSS